MARRKSKLMDDYGSSDSSDDDHDDGRIETNDPDERAADELFRNPYNRGKHKRQRQDLKEEGTYGIWAQTSDADELRGAGPGARRAGGPSRRSDMAKAPSFVSAGTKSSTAPQAPIDNLAEALAIEPAREDEEDVAMELGSSDQGSEVDRNNESDDDSSDSDSPGRPDDDEAELAPVPGLGGQSRTEEDDPAETAVDPGASLAFAPRGIGAGARGRGGLGAARGGIGTRTAGASGSVPIFASATSASDMPLGGTRARTDDDEKQNGTESPMAGAATPRTGIGSSSGIGASRAGIGGGRTGIGARPQVSLADAVRDELASERAQEPTTSDVPAPPVEYKSQDEDSQQAPRERRSFLPTATATSMSAAAPKIISKKERQHFAKLESSGSLGLKMLQKMGWKSGTGLGMNEQGIVTPIGEGQKVRAARQGLASGERSAGALAEEARRRGVEPEELDRADKKSRKAIRNTSDVENKPQRDAWKHSKRKEPKKKTEYKTYEQIVAESGAEAPSVGVLVDLTGNALPDQSLSSLPAYGAGSADPTRLPELRHNLTLLTSTFSSTLNALAREGKGVEERRNHLLSEEQRIKSAVAQQEQSISQLKGVMDVISKIKQIGTEVGEFLTTLGAKEAGPKALLTPFNDHFDELLGRYPDEYKTMRLDDAVVGAIAPICRQLFQSWDPLENPTYAVVELKRWRRHFMFDKAEPNSSELDVFRSRSYANGGKSRDRSEGDRVMTAYETMMWTVWLPRVRSAINNLWSPEKPLPAVNLFVAWSTLLPRFLRDNVLDQLILPKVSKAIDEWSASRLRHGGPLLHTIVFPWLEHAGDRMEEILDEAKRKVRSWLKSWNASEGVPQGLDVWKDAFPSSDWDPLVLRHVLPQLGITLRERFTVNPRDQDMKPLEAVLAWNPLVRSSMMSQLLETEFFPKWLDALYVWLTSEPNLEQVAEWYSWWKSYFPDEVAALSGVSRGFRKGLDLMNQAMALGDDVKFRLKRPDIHRDNAAQPSQTSSKSQSRPSTKSSKTTTNARGQSAAVAAIDEDDVSFRTIVEDVASESNLMVLPLNKTDERGHSLFRVSLSVDGKSGVTVYFEDDVVWLVEKGQSKPVSVDDMVKRALAK
ncbi:hypothetical protein OIV83_001608 [Microbotryomycetes sp. JL201]|nr:hypothetical protein OIV83_001608 [Microbotryomycetes sp. JL201]